MAPLARLRTSANRADVVRSRRERLTEAYEALGRDEGRPMTDLLDPDVVWRAVEFESGADEVPT
jgi:hypothetical protein